MMCHPGTLHQSLEDTLIRAEEKVMRRSRWGKCGAPHLIIHCNRKRLKSGIMSISLFLLSFSRLVAPRPVSSGFLGRQTLPRGNGVVWSWMSLLGRTMGQLLEPGLSGAGILSPACKGAQTDFTKSCIFKCYVFIYC